MNVRKNKYSKIINDIARKEGRTPDEIYNDMQTAIDEGMKNRDLSSDDLWEQFHGRRPTVEEFMDCVIKEVHKKSTTQ